MSGNVNDLLNQADSLAVSRKPASTQIKSKSFIDENGFETYFVKNKGNTNLHFSKLGVTINRGEVRDLLEITDIDALNKSSELRTFLSMNKKLVRLTKEEFLFERAKKEDFEQKRDAMQIAHEERLRNESSSAKNAKPIRAVVNHKVTMLQNFFSNDMSKAAVGLNPADFMEWAETEDFMENEIDFVINTTSDNEVKGFMYKRKKELFG